MLYVHQQQYLISKIKGSQQSGVPSFQKCKWTTFCHITCNRRVISPVLEDGHIMYSSCNKAEDAKQQNVPNEVLRIFSGTKRLISDSLLLNETLETRGDAYSMILFCKCLHNKVQQYLTDHMPEHLRSPNTSTAASPTFPSL